MDIHRILRDELGYYSYKNLLNLFSLMYTSLGQKYSLIEFEQISLKEQTRKIFLSNKRLFEIDGVYSVQKDQIWVSNYAEVNENGTVIGKRQFSRRIMVWLGTCSKGITRLPIFEDATLDHALYVEEVLPVALGYSNRAFGNDWIFKQDGDTRYTYHLVQE